MVGLTVIVLALAGGRAAEAPNPAISIEPQIFPASDEAEIALKTFRPARGLKVDLFAAEPLLANPVAFTVDNQGRAYVVETYRRLAGVLDIESRVDWEDPEITRSLGANVVADDLLSGDLACRTVEENLAFLRRHLGPRAASLTGLSERVRLITPGQGGKAGLSSIFAEGFNRMGDGVAAGILAQRGQVLFGCLPDLWELRDPKGTGAATERKLLQHGYGVHVGTGSHSLHGFKIGPDGKLYFSMGDRGASVTAWDGTRVDNPESGAVFRCRLDGSHLELFATGLRNPQSLAFDQFGNLFTGDNNSDGGDPSRWVYVVEGGDSGWRVGYQYIEVPPDAEDLVRPPRPRGAWLNEGQCLPAFEGQAAFLVPPVANIANGPSGLVFYPGVGLPDRYNEHFFLCDFKGSAANSLIHAFASQPKGAGFEMVDRSVLISNTLPTDVAFGPDGRLYFSDWVQGWKPPGKGRLYRVFSEDLAGSALALETKRLLGEGLEGRSITELSALLGHPDQRVRQAAQFALADVRAVDALALVLNSRENRLARLHALWALGQIQEAAADLSVLDPVVPLLADADPEAAAQAARTLGDARCAKALPGLLALVADSRNPRGQFFSALALGKLGRPEAAPAVVAMLRANDNRDPFLRHAGVMALAGLQNLPALIADSEDSAPSVRMAALLALRRQSRPEVARFLRDSDPAVAVEAALAITDAGIYPALSDLAGLLGDTDRWRRLPDGSNGRPDFLNPFLRRAVNANFRLGDAQSARALADFALQAAAPEAVRVEALQRLAQWDKPSPRDAITGLYRPLPPRERAAAIWALRPALGALWRDPSRAIRMAAAQLAGRYQLREAEPDLLALVLDPVAPARVRVASLRALSELPMNPRVEQAFASAENDPVEALRLEAARIRARVGGGASVTHLLALLERGTTPEQQNALALLGNSSDSAADRLLAGQLDRLLSGKLKRELQLDLLEAAEKRSSPLLQPKLAQYQASLPAGDDLASFRPALWGGDAREGRRIFLQRAEVACLRCHRIGSDGSEVGPVLSSVGARLNREAILESIVYPNKSIAPGFETTVLRLRDGSVQAGILKSENDVSITVNSPESGLLQIPKADVASRERGLSGMPEGFGAILSKRDLRDLVEFLAGQR